MTSRQRVWLILSIAGLVCTWYFNVQFMQAHPGDPWAFVRLGMANPASSSLTLDVSIAAITFVVWMWQEAARLGMKHRWFYAFLTLGVALAFAFPLFLLVREKYLQPRTREGGSP